MDQDRLNKIFSQDYLDTLLPKDISNDFFDALYGDASEGTYDIRLKFVSANEKKIVLEFNLVQRPEKCLVCSLTYGLPNVFSRHPLININGMVEKLAEKGIKVKNWELGNTNEQSAALHVIPLYMTI